MQLDFWILFLGLVWATSHKGWRSWVFFLGNCSFCDIGTATLVISDCKCVVCLYSTMDGFSVLGGRGSFWGLLFIPLDFCSRPFWERSLGVLLRLVGAME